MERGASNARTNTQAHSLSLSHKKTCAHTNTHTLTQHLWKERRRRVRKLPYSYSLSLPLISLHLTLSLSPLSLSLSLSLPLSLLFLSLISNAVHFFPRSRQWPEWIFLRRVQIFCCPEKNKVWSRPSSPASTPLWPRVKRGLKRRRRGDAFDSVKFFILPRRRW